VEKKYRNLKAAPFGGNGRKRVVSRFPGSAVGGTIRDPRAITRSGAPSSKTV
jgi:hypothetical protein